MNADLLRKSTRLGARTRFLLTAGTALPLALLAAPAQAACTVEGDTTTCVGDNSDGISTNTPNVVVSGITSDITPAAGIPAIWMPGVTDADIDLGDHALNVRGVPAIATLDAQGAVEIDFVGTINASGVNTANGSAGGINLEAANGGAADIVLRSTGDVTVNATRDPSVSTFGNVGIAANGGTGTASITSTGDVGVTVAGEPGLLLGISALGAGGASVTNTGNVSLSGPSGIGSGISVISSATSTVASVGDISVDLGTGGGPAIAATGSDIAVDSQGALSSASSGIIARGTTQFDGNGGIAGFNTAETVEISSEGDILTTGDNAAAILALAEEVTVSSTGNITTAGDLSGGIIAMRDYSYDASTDEVNFDDGARSVSVTSIGDITTAGDGSIAIAAGAGAGTATVSSTGDIATAGEFGIGIAAAGQAVTIDSDGSITTGGAYGHGIIVAGDFAMVGEDPETMAAVAGDISIVAGDVATSGMSAMGIRAYSSDGDVTVTANSVATSGEDDGEGNFAEAVFAESINGTASVDVGNASAEGFAASAAVALGGAGAHISADTASAAGQQAAALYASSANGAASVDAGSVTLRGNEQAGVNALAYGGAATVTVDSVVGEGTLGNGVFAEATGGVTVTSGTVDVQRNGVVAYGLDGSDVTIVTTGDTTTETGHAIYGSGENVAVTTAEGSITRGGTSGIRAVAGDSVTILNGGTAVATGDLGSAIHVTAPGAVSITSDAVEVTGAGAFPGGRDDGSNLRLEQGGIIVEGGAGAIAIDAGTVEIDGEHRYGISARGSGAISIAVESVDLASADSAAIAARGGEGDVTITTGTVITTGASGTGVVAQTTSGAISIDAGTTRIENDGSAGPFLGEAIYASSGSGAVDIVAADTFNAALGGSAIVGLSAGDVTIDGGIVHTTGEGGIAVYASSSSGDATVLLDKATATGAGAVGAYVGAISGAASLTTTGDVTVADGYAIRGQGASVAIETGVDTTTSGTTGIRVHNGVSDFGNGPAISPNAGSVEIANQGTVIGTGTGLGSGAINVSTTGDVDIVSNAARSTGDAAYGIFAQSFNGNVAIDSGSIVLTGDQPPIFVTNPDGTFTLSDYSAIRAVAFGGDVDLRVGDISAAGELGRGIFAQGRNVDITVDGTIVADSAIIASSVDQPGSIGTVNIVVNGEVKGSAAAGISTLGQARVEIAEGASVSGGQYGVVMSDSQSPIVAQLYNSGTIEASDGPAVGGNSFAQQTDFYIQNNGVLIGGNGLAVQTAGGNDTLELTNLSLITGIADLGDGDDRLVLDFNDDAPEGAVGQVVATVNVEGLSVDTGSWLANGTQSQYGFVEIEEGATLTVVGNEDGELAIATGAVELEGALRLDLNVDETDADLGETTIEGAGSLHLIGTARIELADATGLQHTGGTFVENGELLLNTVYGGDITTSGDGVFELGAGGDFTGDLVNDGTFVFSRTDDYSFLGDFTGTGQLDKYGDGRLTFTGFYGFEGTTSVFGGAVAFTGQLSEDTELDLTDGTVDLSQVDGGEQTIAKLEGTGGTLQLGETQLVIDQMGNSAFSGEILGLGTIVKEGEGDLNLNGDGTGFTGTGQVGGGTLSVNGNFGNANFVVNEGGTLGGAGTVGETNVNGGTLAPGNSIGTLTVNGDVSFTAASVYEVEVDPAGNSDRIEATGTATLGGAHVSVIAESGTYRPLTDYTILTADGGVSGTFGSVEANLAFLDPSLSYSANAVTLRLVRNDIDFAAFGANPNQAVVANLIESFGYGNALYNEALTLVDNDVAVSLASLTGEVYPAYGAALIETAEMLRRQTADAAQGEGAFAWATGLYNSVDSGNGAGNIELLGKGVAGGFGYGAGGFTATAGAGKLDQDRGGSQFSDGDVTFAIGRLGWTGATGVSINAGVQFGWIEGETRRQTQLGAINQAVTGEIDGDYVQLFGEIGYRMPVGGGFVAEPFAGISHVSIDLDGVTETGAATALAVAAIDRAVTFADIGLRVSGDAATGVRPFASAAYRHAWGDRASVSAFGFAGFAGTGLVAAVPIARSAAEVSGGVVVTRGMIDFEVGYDATISKEFNSHGVNAGFKVRF